MEAGKREGSSVIKHLASCNKTTRDKALKLLKTWLPTQPQLSDEDMKKIWKGLFYCVWHADKLPVQTELIDRLSSLLLTLDLPLSLHYFSVFLLTMRREWSGIDALRLDKFYLLIRRFIHNFFLLLKRSCWDLELSRRLMGVLEERTFLADDQFQGNGVNYHIASVFLDELKPFLPVRFETLDVLFKPFFSVMGKSPDKVLLGKIKSNVFDLLLQMGKSLLEVKKSGGDVDSGDDVVVFGTIALMVGFSTKFFDLGSSPDCIQGNRKVLFGLHEDFLKLEKDLASSGIEISIPEPDVKDGDDDEVPSLIPITTEGGAGHSEVGLEPVEVVLEVVNGPACTRSKQTKKAKKGSVGSRKKAKMNNNKAKSSPAVEDNDTVTISNGENSNDEQASDGNLITFNEFVISNLQMQFEKVAAEAGLDNDGKSACDLPKVTVNGTVSKKRKRAKRMDGQDLELSSQGDAEGDATAKTGEKSEKKVRFSMKSNLVWKPHSPLPPQSLRLPPSATPRGSALKKGIPPGPISEIPLASKKMKRASSVKKGRRGKKSISPAIKRRKKLKSISI
ncbi:hypothetical protein L1049_021735 [Liquidambar formosana]|uniref:Ribosomal RNA processing protein 1 homolog n=1 Tax=Liquidambar formosana TaxID=63359 RepID=A0AAP0RCD3_LIQFO